MNQRKILENNIKSFNNWFNTEIDIDGLGAGGRKNHLIIKGTQNKLTNLLSDSELIDYIRCLSEYLSRAKLQRSEPKE